MSVIVLPWCPQTLTLFSLTNLRKFCRLIMHIELIQIFGLLCENFTQMAYKSFKKFYVTIYKQINKIMGKLKKKKNFFFP